MALGKTTKAPEGELPMGNEPLSLRTGGCLRPDGRHRHSLPLVRREVAWEMSSCGGMFWGGQWGPCGGCVMAMPRGTCGWAGFQLPWGGGGIQTPGSTPSHPQKGLSCQAPENPTETDPWAPEVTRAHGLFGISASRGLQRGHLCHAFGGGGGGGD